MYIMRIPYTTLLLRKILYIIHYTPRTHVLNRLHTYRWWPVTEVLSLTFFLLLILNGKKYNITLSPLLHPRIGLKSLRNRSVSKLRIGRIRYYLRLINISWNSKNCFLHSSIRVSDPITLTSLAILRAQTHQKTRRLVSDDVISLHNIIYWVSYIFTKQNWSASTLIQFQVRSLLVIALSRWEENY